MIWHSQTDSIDTLLGEIANELSERRANGENPSVEEYAQQHPQIAHMIRMLFPALNLLKGDSKSAPHSPETDADHHRLGDFRIHRELGRGGMGIVYEAEEVSLGRKVALKVLPLAGMLDEKQIKRFKNEARSAATLDHPNIVPVLSVGEERGVYYYAMSLVDGQNMAEVIHEIRRLSDDAKPATKGKISDISTDIARTWKNGPAFFRTVAKLGIQAAEALHHAHENGILHRDIKPGNLMLDTEGKLWVTDFGLARLESEASLTMTGDLIGTLRYMSPEQALARPGAIDQRSDIYSLGVTLYELLTLQPAFDSTVRAKLLRQIAFEEPRKLRKLNPSAPLDLETIVFKAMANDPQERYLTAEELAQDLKCFIDDRPIQAQPPTLAIRATKWLRRHPEVVRSAFCLLVFMVVGLSLGAGLLHQANLRTIEQRRAAQNDFRLALLAVNHLIEIADTDLVEVPSAEPIRNDMLQSSLDFYTSLLDQHEGDNHLQAALAETYVRMGMIQNQIGTDAETLRAFHRALAIRKTLANRHPNAAQYQLALAESYGKLARIHTQESRSDKVSKYRERQIAILEQIPDLETYPDGMLALARCYYGQSNKTVADRLAIIDVRTRLAEAHPEIGKYQTGLGVAYRDLAHVYHDKQQLDEALAAIGKSIQIRGRLVKRHPDVGLYQSGLARSWQSLAVFECTRNDYVTAEHLLEKSMAIFTAMRQRRPLNRFNKSNVAECYCIWAKLKAAIGMRQEAADYYEAAISEYQECEKIDPTRRFDTIRLAEMYRQVASLAAASGELNQALSARKKVVRELEELAAQHPDETSWQHSLALEHSAIADLEEQLQRLDDVESSEAQPR